ncbi:MAG: hypothetical protein JXB15_04810 [Anaerolineales bacterium]|nr:hypothetical protein [Anaerolineales bacterium]
MAEVNEDAMTLISISWQALNRAVSDNKDTILCDCTVIILFACIFIEANLNHIIKEMNMTQQMRQFCGMKKKNQHPGLQHKLGWFYNKCVSRNKAKSTGDKRYAGIQKKLGRKFPGYSTLSNFRNDISHGTINPTIASLASAMKLRQQAKDIVDELFRIAKKNGYNIPRTTTYQDVIAIQERNPDNNLNSPNKYFYCAESSS